MSMRGIAFWTALSFLSLAGCGGGGSGGNSSGASSSSSSSGSSSSAGTTSLQLNLATGDSWTFFWNASTLTFSQSGTLTSADNGEFTVTLGAPVSLGGEAAFPLSVSGDPGEFDPRWTHVAVAANGSLLGSTNGVNLETVYDADTDD